MQRYLIIATTVGAMSSFIQLSHLSQALAFLVGYALQQIHVTAIIFAAGCLLTALVGFIT